MKPSSIYNIDKLLFLIWMLHVRLHANEYSMGTDTIFHAAPTIQPRQSSHSLQLVLCSIMADYSEKEEKIIYVYASGVYPVEK